MTAKTGSLLPHRRSCFALVLVAFLPALAQGDTEARLAAMEARLVALETENARLRLQLDTPATTTTRPAAATPSPGRALKVAGYVQLHAETGGAPDARFNGIDDRFFIRRADLSVRGDLGHDFAFKIEAELASGSLAENSGHRAQLTDAYVTWSPNDQAGLMFGQFKTPFGRAQLMANTKLPMVERPLASDRLTVGRQVGAALGGRIGETVPVSYSVGVFNGTGTNSAFTTDSDFMTAGRVSALLWSHDHTHWEVAANAFHHNPAVTGRNERTGWGIDTRLTLGPVVTEAEYLKNEYDRTGQPVSAADGWWITSVWQAAPAWQLVLNHGRFDPDTNLPGDDTTSWTFGANHLIRGEDLMLSLNYLLGDTPAGRDDRLLGRVQVKF